MDTPRKELEYSLEALLVLWLISFRQTDLLNSLINALLYLVELIYSEIKLESINLLHASFIHFVSNFNFVEQKIHLGNQVNFQL
jgi:hypothetical protein